MSCLSWRGIFHKNWEIKLKFQMGGLRETGGLLFFLPKGALTHHRVGTNSISFAPPQAAGLIHSVVPPFPTKSATLWEPFCGGGIACGNRALCEADAAAAAASRQCHNTCGCCCHRLRRSQLFPFWKQLATCPHKTATGSFVCGYDPKLDFGSFSLLRKRNRKRKNEVKKIWRFIIWKRRWSAGAQAAPQ